MEIDSYTVDEMFSSIKEKFPGSEDEFMNRINSYGFDVQVILAWHDTDVNISNWLTENRSNMEGKVIWPFSCQLDFECIEDAVQFKMRWA